jgi:asparagine synthase (glutamine-hydrolysing)
MPALPLSRLELAAGVVWGEEPAPELPRRTGDPMEALEQACLPALLRPPCVVSFSGGGDSSAVLAVAVTAARRQGLPLPVPVSLRFPGVPSTQESDWQELVVAHLQLEDWQRVEIGPELDFLSSIARRGLGEHGLLWPANAHFHVPVFERAAGGSVLTGIDGDGLFGGWRWQRAQAVLARRARPSPRDGLRVAFAVLPSGARAAVLQRRHQLHMSWLRAQAARRVRQELAREAASEPRSWPARVAWFARRRYLRAGIVSLGLLAEPHDVQVHHPLADPEFLSALAADGGPAGYGTRLGATRRLFGGLLPTEVVERRTKAEFGRALWGPEARAFAAAWEGGGVDSELVDADRLRSVWREPNPPLAAATVLQHAWLSSAGASAAGRPAASA